MNADVESFEAIGIARRVEQQIESFGVGAFGFGAPDDSAIGLGDDAKGIRGIVDEAGGAAAKARVKFANESAAVCNSSWRKFPFRKIVQRIGGKTAEELRVNLIDEIDHFADDGASFGGRVGGGAHALEAMENNARDGVNHGRKRGDGQNVSSNFDRTFFSSAFDFLNSFWMGHWADVPDVLENGTCVGNKKRRELAIVRPSASDGMFVDRFARLVEEKRDGRDESLDTIHADVALALLLGIVKRMGMKEGPDELPADIFKAEFEMSVLKDRVMAAVESGGADIEALFVRDFRWADEGRRIAGAGCGDRGVERMREGVAESDARRRSLNEIAMRTFEHARLSGHVGGLFYRNAEA